MSVKLLPCPFCGHDSPEFERMGTPRQSCIVVCGNCGARHQSSDEGERSGTQWNCREGAAADDVRDAIRWRQIQYMNDERNVLPHILADYISKPERIDFLAQWRAESTKGTS